MQTINPYMFPTIKGPFFLRNRKPKSSDPSHQSFSTGSNQALGGKGAGMLFSITDNPIAGPGFFLEKRLTFRAGKGGHTDMTTYGKNMKMKLLWLQFLVLWPNLELMTLFLCFCPRKKTTAPKKVLFFFNKCSKWQYGLYVYFIHWTQAGVV